MDFVINIIMKKITQLLIIFLTTYSALSAQNGVRTTVILYNVTPLKVDLAPDGTIVNIHGKEEDYFKGYTLVKNADSDDILATSDGAFYTPSKDFAVAPKALNLDYRSDLALLSSKAIAAIDESVAYLSANPSQKVMITPYKGTGTSDQLLLLDNRIKTVLMYLEIKGIPKNRIALNGEPQTTIPNQMILTFLK
jgi:hypothetical protein